MVKIAKMTGVAHRYTGSKKMYPCTRAIFTVPVWRPFPSQGGCPVHIFMSLSDGQDLLDCSHLFLLTDFIDTFTPSSAGLCGRLQDIHNNSDWTE